MGASKILERLLLNRMSAHISGALTPSQFEFRSEAILTIAADAAKEEVQDRHLCVLITLDVRNVFNSTPWHLILTAVAGFGVPQCVRRLIWSYLSDRTIMVPSGNGTIRRGMMCGVPQGSVLGPTLWNVFNDGLLRVKLPDGVFLIGFADDVALMIVDHITEGLERAANEQLKRIGAWIHSNGLSHTKTEAIMLTKNGGTVNP